VTILAAAAPLAPLLLLLLHARLHLWLPSRYTPPLLLLVVMVQLLHTERMTPLLLPAHLRLGYSATHHLLLAAGCLHTLQQDAPPAACTPTPMAYTHV
jgi:hypothetical protein